MNKLSGLRLLLLLVACTLAVAGFFPTAGTAGTAGPAGIDLPGAGPCGDMGCPGGPNFCDYLDDDRTCNCNTDNCQS